MALILIALLFGGLGFAVRRWRFLATVFAIAWVAGFALRCGEESRWWSVLAS